MHSMHTHRTWTNKEGYALGRTQQKIYYITSKMPKMTKFVGFFLPFLENCKNKVNGAPFWCMIETPKMTASYFNLCSKHIFKSKK